MTQFLRRTVGEAVVVKAQFSDEAGQPLAATGTVFRVRSPSGVETDAAAQPDGAAGRFRAFVTATEAGVWTAFAECDGPEKAVTMPVKFRALPRPF